VILGLEFPPIDDIVKWPDWFFKDTAFGFNKVALIYVLALVIPALFFFIAGRQKGFVPRGFRNAAEVIIGFVEKQIMLPTMGPEGGPFLPLLVTLFSFIFVANIFEVIPAFQMPGNARMAAPIVLALTVWVVLILVGLNQQGLKYIAHIAWPPGVPTGLKPLVGIIEVLSTFFIRPFSHSVRLFANMLAGHILLVTFSVLCISLWTANALFIVNIPTFFMLVALTGFEIGVAFLQAFVFAILTGVYIGGSMQGHGDEHPLHDDIAPAAAH
jgi:F-type H+-transporting ATPase subunit a